MVGNKNSGANGQHRQGAAFQADGHAVNDVGGIARLAGFRHPRDRRGRGVVFGDKPDPDPDDAAGSNGPENPGCDREDGDQNQRRDNKRSGGNKTRIAQRVLRTRILERLHREDAQKRGQQTDHGHAERQGHEGVALAAQMGEGIAVNGGTDGNRGNNGTHIGLENVRAHTGHIADIIPDVIGNHTGIAGVVFGDAGLNFADQVAADIRGLGINAASDPRKQGDGTGAHGKATDVG